MVYSPPYQKSIGSNQLEEWVKQYKELGRKGTFADYIPALQKSNSTDLGITVMGVDGTAFHAGTWATSFTLQSISKIITFILACMQKDLSTVLKYVDVEPTGDPFNSIIRLEANSHGKPFNPLINAGAITVCSLLTGEHAEEKLGPIIDFIEEMIDRRPQVNEEVFQSERKTGFRNRALAYFLKETGYLKGDVETALDVYFSQCSIELNTAELAQIGLILSQDGYHPFKKRRLFDAKIAKVAKALMLTCGLYNSSGKLAAFIGVPAKSGVSGGILATVPARASTSQKNPFPEGCGIGIYGPAIDSVGNSYAGTNLLKQLSIAWELNIF